MKFTVLLTALAVVLGSCSIIDGTQKCGDLMCTMEYVTVGIKFRNNAGQLIDVNSFSAVLKKSGQETAGASYSEGRTTGYYVIASDTDKNKLSPAGDTIEVSGINPVTNQRKSAQVVVIGGACVCHIQKKSGPEEIRFD